MGSNDYNGHTAPGATWHVACTLAVYVQPPRRLLGHETFLPQNDMFLYRNKARIDTIL